MLPDSRTLKIMRAMARRRMNARTIALKVYADAAFEGEVCKLLGMRRVTPRFAEGDPKALEEELL